MYKDNCLCTYSIKVVMDNPAYVACYLISMPPAPTTRLILTASMLIKIKNRHHMWQCNQTRCFTVYIILCGDNQRCSYIGYNSANKN